MGLSYLCCYLSNLQGKEQHLLAELLGKELCCQLVLSINALGRLQQLQAAAKGLAGRTRGEASVLRYLGLVLFMFLETYQSRGTYLSTD